MKNILPFVMCGGIGTRLWPESRQKQPKQFLPLIDGRSTFQLLVYHIHCNDAFSKPLRIITHADYQYIVADQLDQLNIQAEVILEPISRDSALSLAIAAHVADRCEERSIVALFASDHFIPETEAWIRCVQEAAYHSEECRCILFGVKPDRASSQFGYILPDHISPHAEEGGEEGEKWPRRVVHFSEKPAISLAEKYIGEGYLWHVGHMVFDPEHMIQMIEEEVPSLNEAALQSYENGHWQELVLHLDEAPLLSLVPMSLDHAILQKRRDLYVQSIALSWLDLGNWDMMRSLATPDSEGNSIAGHGIVLQSKNVYIRSSGPLTAAVGVENVSIITTKDSVLVVGSGSGEKIKNLVIYLRQQGYAEAIDNKQTRRRWGYYEILHKSHRYQVKRLSLKPRAQISLQSHLHRSEYWVIVQGVAEVRVNREIKTIYEGESVHLPLGEVHCLRNPGHIDLELIEVQIGSYLEENDIVRVSEPLGSRSAAVDVVV